MSHSCFPGLKISSSFDGYHLTQAKYISDMLSSIVTMVNFFMILRCIIGLQSCLSYCHQVCYLICCSSSESVHGCSTFRSFCCHASLSLLSQGVIVSWSTLLLAIPSLSCMLILMTIGQVILHIVVLSLVTVSNLALL
jgi:hypothetical protein